MVIVILVLLGLCLGSFVNAFTWRLHEQGKPKKQRKVPNKDLSVLTGRSMCPNCHHTLAWYDLLPVISWLNLGGKCRYCHKPISWQYPVVELLTAGLMVFSYVFWPTSFSGTEQIILFGFWLIFLTGFVALAVYDIKWMLLPDKIVYSLLTLAGVELLVRIAVSGPGAILEAFWGFLCLGGLFYLLFQISKGKWIGGGDVKLGFVLGILVGGPLKALLVLFVASWIGSIVGIAVVLSQKSGLKKRIPFGPFLILATGIVYLFGSAAIAWYKAHFLSV